MSLPVYLAAALDPPLDDLGVGDLCRVSGSQAHHAVNSRRLRVGEQLELVDGRGKRVRVEVVDVDRQTFQARVSTLTCDPVATPRLVLVQALAKNKRDLQAIESACEVGVDVVYPWAASRCVVSWKAKDTAKNLRWASTLNAASTQSRRAHWPQLEDLCHTGELVEHVRGACALGEVVLLAHETAVTPLTQVLGEQPGAPAYWVIIGPEGGITGYEVDVLTEAGAHAVWLGPTIMRSSTAGPVALAVIAATQGRWSAVKPPSLQENA